MSWEAGLKHRTRFSSYKLLLARSWVHNLHLKKSGAPHLNVAMNELPLFKHGSKARKHNNCH